MWYILGGLVLGIVAAGWALTGSVSLRKRDEHSIHHYKEEAHFYQSFQNWHNNG